MERESEGEARLLWGRASCPSSRILDGGKQQHRTLAVHLCWPPRQSTAPRSQTLSIWLEHDDLPDTVRGDDSDALTCHVPPTAVHQTRHPPGAMAAGFVQGLGGPPAVGPLEQGGDDHPASVVFPEEPSKGHPPDVLPRPLAVQPGALVGHVLNPPPAPQPTPRPLAAQPGKPLPRNATL